MVERIRFSRTIQGALLGFALPLLLTGGSGWAQNSSNPEEIAPYIEKIESGSADNCEDGISGLKKIGAPAAQRLGQLFKDNNNDKSVRLCAARALKEMGWEARAAIPHLTSIIEKDTKENFEFFKEAVDATMKIASELAAKRKQLSREDYNQVIPNLEKALKAIEEINKKNPQVNIKTSLLSQSIDLLKQESEDKKNYFERTAIWFSEHEAAAIAAGVVIYCISLSSLWSTLLWVRPLWLLQINEFLRSHIDFELPKQLGGIKMPTRYGILVGFFNYQPRVLDAWVEANIARYEFDKKKTVKERDIYVPVPVVMDGKNRANLTAKDLQPKLAEKRECILIWGEGGSGKTSLACQLAKWAMSENPEERLCEHKMLPVLLEQELDFEVAEGKQVFIEAIRGSLGDLINSQVPISEELLEQLLRQQRLLVIVDRFSEMSEDTRKQIRPELPKFPVNALVVTSRVEENLGGVNKTVLKPMRVEGDKLSSFMEAYLTQRGKRNLFSDRDFFDGCSRLSAIAGQRHITVLLAKLYAEQMIAAKADDTPGDLPDNVPELMLHYLNQLNRNIEDNKLDDRAVHRDAKAIAWQCLQQTYRPAAAKRDDVLAALEEDDAEARLDYLEKRLHLIQTIGAARDKIRFSLDPLAEYLAALRLVELQGDNERLWHDFFASADAMPDAPNRIQGFLLAVQDCCLFRSSELKLPDFLLEEIAQRTAFEQPGFGTAER